MVLTWVVLAVYGDNVLCNGGPSDSQWVNGLVRHLDETDRQVTGGCTVHKPALEWSAPAFPDGAGWVTGIMRRSR